MIREVTDCIDAGTEYCPCKLAENNECILCSQMHGKCFCDCLNWKGVCIYQEFCNNGMKAKEGRKTYDCEVIRTENIEGDILIIEFKVHHKLALDLVRPGSYVFLCTDDDRYFDVPISIMDSDISTNIVSVAIEIRGVKTKRLLQTNVGDNLRVRGPYWNGVFGIKNIEKQNSAKTLIIARGMGVAPMIPVIRKLSSLNNEITVCMDLATIKEDFTPKYLSNYKIDIVKNQVLDKGDLSSEAKVLIKKALENGVNYIHLAGADILTYSTIDFLNSINRKDVLLSCCNNFKMCCGEGICGACTARYKGHKVKRFCKEQIDPRRIFEGRRLI